MSWNYTFNGRSDDILDSDKGKTRDIAGFMNQNSSARLTIDGPSKRYVHAVVEALTDAGIPKDKIQIGAATDPAIKNDHMVYVTVSN
jgi:hypothetical protein